jgi:VWFA-related protein
MPLLIMLLLGSSLFAQQKDDEIPVFRASVTLIRVDIQVTGRNGKAISDFTQQDFLVFDENQPQQVAHFGRESEPLDLLLLLDISGSMRRSLEDVAAATRAALAQLRPGDRVGLMLFARRAEVVQPFTEDLRSTQNKILDSIYKQNLGSGTLINESLIAAADYMKQQPVKGRRAVLIVTDNEGLNYKSPDSEVVRAMHSADTVLNALVVRKGGRPPVVNRARYTNPDFDPPDVYAISEKTGGEAVEGLGKVSEMFQRMIERIRSRYFIQYPAPQAEPGTFRHIRVELAPEAKRKYPDATVRAREGYYATP